MAMSQGQKPGSKNARQEHTTAMFTVRSIVVPRRELSERSIHAEESHS